eukprot:TRINITY_DN74104_c0_g1_i1.p1 TRINITY_DN74104_c0_g1~~TRINITY_DN74104_c0_g1_i1.p1  ORF type:complete len:317 (+),score=71.67 TRINITY_DN74104_c0_g1_i1:52-951(+)
MATCSASSVPLLLALAFPAWASQNFVRREHHEASVAASGDVRQSPEVANEAAMKLAQELLSSKHLGIYSAPLPKDAPVEGKVYEVHFRKGDTQMCWMKELPGCRSSSQACDVEYCPVGGISKAGICECMQVMVKSCKIGENGTTHTQIWTEAAVEFGSAEQTRFWRAVRVKYLDSEASLGSGAKDKGKTLETAQVCNSEACQCDKSQYYRWLLEEGKIKWASYSSDDAAAEEEEKEGKQAAGGGVSIGPIPNNVERNATMTVKAFNVLDPVGNMYFVPKNMSAAEEAASNSTSLAEKSE